jgi:catechol 2,3-dioxygenase-like lactoylglutathione lyase family enzyme
MAETMTTQELTDSAGRRIIRPHLHHFGTATTRNDEMLEWYRNVVGMEVSMRSEVPVTMTFVSNDLAHHRGGFFSPPFVTEDAEKFQHARIQHLAWEFDSIDDLLETWERLTGLGIVPVAASCHGTHFSCYYKDPDYNTVELLADAFGDMRKSFEFFQTPQMQANPMGGHIDPAKLIEARKQGVELDELRERALAGEYVPAQIPDPMAPW